MGVNMAGIIAYYRVSTRKQGESGLGLEAQRAAVQAHAKMTGERIITEFTEVESGKRSDRPILAAALAQARRGKATLAIAKLDRLARNVAFLSAMMEAGVDFVACDNPTANKLTIHILAAVAEDEARRISERTKAALAAARARGVRLGSARLGHWSRHEVERLAGAQRGNKRSAVVRRERAIAAVGDLIPEMRRRRVAGESFAAIATVLNTAGQRTSTDSAWTAMSVKRALDRVR